MGKSPEKLIYVNGVYRECIHHLHPEISGANPAWNLNAGTFVGERMTPSDRALKGPSTAAGLASAEAGVVVLDGADGVAVTLTPDAAEKTAQSLQEAAHQARDQAHLAGRVQ